LYLKGYSVKEIATKLEITIKQVYSRLHYAKKAKVIKKPKMPPNLIRDIRQVKTYWVGGKSRKGF